MMAKPNPLRSPPKAKKKRSVAFLLIQIGAGGVAGVVLAIIILRFLGADYFGFGRAKEGPVGIAESREIASETSKEVSKKVVPKLPAMERPSVDKKPIVKAIEKPPPVDTPLVSTLPNKEPGETKVTSAPATKLHLPLSKEALAEHFASQKFPSARFWWCDDGVFELDNKGEFRFTARSGLSSQFLPMTANVDYLELENEPRDLRIRLFSDHAESSAAPFEVFKPIYSGGKWLVAPDQTGVDWFFRATADLESSCRQSRAAAKSYMNNLFSAAEKLKAAGKLKDVPFGFDLPAEKERFERTGLVPWTTPLLPMTAEYVQECRKMHRNEQATYGRVAAKLNGQHERLARDFLEYHQWKHTRPWPLAVLAWSDGTSDKEHHFSLLSNGSVNASSSKDTWKLNGDVLDVDIGESRVRIKIGQTGKEFTLLGQEKPAAGKFLFEPVRVAY